MRVVPQPQQSSLATLAAFSAVMLIAPSATEAQSVWRCGKLFTTQASEGCREVKATISTGVDGARVFVSGDAAPSEESRDAILLPARDVATTSAKETDDHPRLTGTLFTTDNERSLGSASIGGRRADTQQQRPTRVIKTGCFASSLYGNQPSGEECKGLTQRISTITNVLK